MLSAVAPGHLVLLLHLRGGGGVLVALHRGGRVLLVDQLLQLGLRLVVLVHIALSRGSGRSGLLLLLLLLHVHHILLLLLRLHIVHVLGHGLFLALVGHFLHPC